MNGIRAFIAISLSQEVHQNLAKVISGLQQQILNAPLRWTPVQNIHLTIKFLGNVSVANLELLTKVLSSELSHHQPFEISIGDLGVFPNIHRPRVIWIGIQAPPELFSLYKGIETEMSRLGYPLEERKYSPHLTLARVSRYVNPEDYLEITRALESSKIGFLGAIKAQTVDLYRSDLHLSGANYTKLAALKMGVQPD